MHTCTATSPDLYKGRKSSPARQATGVETDTAVKAFYAAESAWDTYQKAIATAHAPIYNSFVGGSGTGEFNTRFQIDMLLSQMKFRPTRVPKIMEK